MLLAGVMWNEQVSRARQQIAALASLGLGVTDLHEAAIPIIEREVRTELTCWAVIDPETLVISSMVSGETRIGPEYEQRLAVAEYSGGEPHTFATLAQRRRPVARLSEMPEADRRRSTRLHTVWRPLGIDEELRVLFVVDGACWGAAGMARAGHDFSDRETDFLQAVAPALASATRVAVRCEALRSETQRAPAVVVLDGDGRCRARTPAARDWQEGLDEIAPGRFGVMMQVAAAGARAAAVGSFRARVRDARGQWALLHASRLIGGGEDQVAITIEPVNGGQMLGLLFAAYGLTDREREICGQVLAGRSTAQIAEQLYISANTVQDHLKSVFAKVGVRSRGQLAATLRAA